MARLRPGHPGRLRGPVRPPHRGRPDAPRRRPPGQRHRHHPAARTPRGAVLRARPRHAHLPGAAPRRISCCARRSTTSPPAAAPRSSSSRAGASRARLLAAGLGRPLGRRRRARSPRPRRRRPRRLRLRTRPLDGCRPHRRPPGAACRPSRSTSSGSRCEGAPVRKIVLAGATTVTGLVLLLSYPTSRNHALDGAPRRPGRARRPGASVRIRVASSGRAPRAAVADEHPPGSRPPGPRAAAGPTPAPR